ncbi:hypothetical protein [Muricoccus vinaceus]|uniref:Uncharacterized protein n=1 Tax=Muricoccus vinaceus TaxID=424704 RepID=A0ABV6IX23_9PROT
MQLVARTNRPPHTSRYLARDRPLNGSVTSAIAYTATWNWHMYPPGLLLDLGFDKATEVRLAGISATQASRGQYIGRTRKYANDHGAQKRLG